jgi:hypothetical protein
MSLAIGFSTEKGESATLLHFTEKFFKNPLDFGLRGVIMNT